MTAPLYHGTRYLDAILRSNILRRPIFGDRHVSLTRSSRIAAYWASLPRDDGEGAGAILVFDRDSLRARFRVEAFCHFAGDYALGQDEAEEAVLADIYPLDRFLLACFSEGVPL